jgi:putative pyoverdin transport system ATP-binding/permease protein
MKLIAFLLEWSKGIKRSRAIVVMVIVAGVISGVSNTLLLAVINRAFADTGSSSKQLLWFFIALCAILPLSRFASEALLIRLTATATFDLRMQLSRKILSAPLRLLEEMGSHRLLAILTDDIPMITNALVTIPILCMHFAILAGSLVYLGWLSGKLLLIVLVFMAFGVVSYQLPIMKALRYFGLGREEWDTLFKHFRALTEGTKQLKLHFPRREAFLDEQLSVSALSMQQYNVAGSIYYTAANCWGQVLFFVLIGLLLFVVPGYSPTSSQTLSGYTLALLYLMTPLQVILNMLPTFGHANIALKKVKQLGDSLTSRPSEITSSIAPQPSANWSHLEFWGVMHSYKTESDNGSFMLGPLSLSLRPGELVFLTGGNGSGKTTLAKIISGLYVPEGGEISLDGETITDANREGYRQNFSAVFSDFYMFEKLLGLSRPALDEQARDYLKQLHLDNHVEIRDGIFSRTELSRGQQKRLALLNAYLEDRPIYIFDEWAADQDPMFKQVFYCQILPELKNRGKAVIVISHDDRYYHVADHLIKLDYGKLAPLDCEVVASPDKI